MQQCFSQTGSDPVLGKLESVKQLFGVMPAHDVFKLLFAIPIGRFFLFFEPVGTVFQPAQPGFSDFFRSFVIVSEFDATALTNRETCCFTVLAPRIKVVVKDPANATAMQLTVLIILMFMSMTHASIVCLGVRVK